MRKALFLFSCICLPVLTEGGILDILETKDNSFNLRKQIKKDIGSVFLSDKPVSFIQAFEAQDFEKALEMWLESIQKTPFAKSSTGTALYSYLLFKNGFEALALSFLLKNSQPERVDPIVSRLWKVNIDTTNPVWDTFYFPLSPQWQVFFSPETVFKIGSKAPLHLTRDQAYMKSLLALPVSDQLDVFPLEWLFVLSLIQKKDIDSATKLLSWLLSKIKNSYRKDKVNLTVARLLADIGENQASLHYYKKIKNLSYFWFLAQEEMVRVHWSENNNSQAYSTALALNYPGFLEKISPSSFFVLALSKLRSCDDEGTVQSVKDFKRIFLKKYSQLKQIIKKKRYESLAHSLLAFYASKHPSYQINEVSLFYPLKKDNRLKNEILFYDYLKERGQKRGAKFKKLADIEDQVVKNLEDKIHARIEFLLQKELKSIESALRNFHLIEAEVLYREYGVQNSLVSLYKEPWHQAVSLYKSDGFLHFPFNKEEVWLDELSDYRASANKNCPVGSYVL